MWTRWILPLLIISGVTLILYTLLVPRVVYPISDTLFVSSQIFFFYGLLRVTDASSLVDGFSYSYKRMFTVKNLSEIPKSFFEQRQIKRQERKEKNEPGNPGLAYLLVATIMFIVSYNSLI